MCVPSREKVVPVRCQPLTYPCPTCGRHGRRKRRLNRKVRSLAYGQVIWLHVFSAEYRARCHCRKSFRSCPPEVTPKADYDNLVRQAVLNRILDDGLTVERTRAAMKRDFLLDLSSGFIYDCLDWGLSRLNQTEQRQAALQHESGTICIDELHLGEHTLLLATDPISDRTLGYSLVSINDQAYLRRFLLTLSYWGFNPKVVVTDGSNLYPAVLQEVWPKAKHQLCVFHVLQDVNKQVLSGVRRLRREQARRGNGGRKSKKQQARKRRRGPTAKEKSAFVYKHRFLIVKRTENLTKKDWQDLVQLVQYLPDLRRLWYFCRDVYRIFNTEQVIRLARRERAGVLRNASYQEVPELVKAQRLLDGEKFEKMVAYLKSEPGTRVRTNNHVERANRKVRYDEKVRYKWRTGKSKERFLRLSLVRVVTHLKEGTPPLEPDPVRKPALSGAPFSGGD
jgi:Transposase